MGLIWRAGTADKCYDAGAPLLTISDECTIEDKHLFKLALNGMGRSL